jgi:hypothetical protein
MSQKTRNIRLMVILAMLALSAIVLGLTRNESKSTLENIDIFAVQDTARVDLISIIHKDKTIKLQKTDGVWILNDRYKAEQNIVRVLLSILKDADVVRNVPKTQAASISEMIRERGYLVEISADGKTLQSFYASGNENKTVSYMMPVDKAMPKTVNIPGYESYVAGIFEIPADDWRDRTILSTTWRALQRLDVDFAQFPEYSFAIEFKFNFLHIDGIEKLDTARMMGYIEQFNYLQADKYLARGQNEKYDSLLQTPETVTVSVTDINPENSKSIHFYPLIPDDPMMLGYVKEDEQMVLFQADRIQTLFAVKAEFELGTIQ